METYIKNKQEVGVSPKFVYYSSVYKIWKNGACLLNDKWYASENPINLKAVKGKIKKKDYSIQRFIELKSAPEDYLISHGYRRMKNVKDSKA
jgi:hypothetical protein